MANGNEVQLLISLGVNSEQSKSNINEYIRKLKTEDLNVTLNINNAKSNDKAFSDMQKQIETLQNKIKELNSQLSNIGNSPSKSGNIFIGVGRDLKQVQEQINSFLKNQGFQNFDFKINADVSDGEKTLKNFVANIRDAQGEIRKLTFMPDGTGSFKEIKESLSDNSTIQYNKTLKDIDETIVSISRNGLLGSQRIEEFSNAINKIKNDNFTSLDSKVSGLRKELDLLNKEFDEVKYIQKMEDEWNKAAIAIQNLESSLIKTKNVYKRETQFMDLSTWENEIKSLQNTPKFTTQTDIDDFNKKINTAKANLKELSVSVSTGARNSLTFAESFSTAMEKFTIWMGASTIFYGFFRGINDLIDKVVELDTALVELRRVLDLPDYKFNELLEQSITNIDALSGKLSDYMNLVTEFGRMGYNDKEIIDMSNTAQMLTNISDLSADESVDSLVAAMTAFNITAEESVSIADKLNEVKC